MSNCSQCNLVAEESLSIRHRTCSHVTHVDCLTEPINYKLCQNCVSGGDGAKGGGTIGGQAAPPSFTEPHTTDGHNYILYPGKKQAPSVLKSLGSLLSTSKAPVENVKTSQNPEFLLNNRVPIEQLMKQNKLGLDHLLKAGITIDDFLKNQYDWNDLCKFEYVQKGGKRALQTLAIGLLMDANHVRDYGDQLPGKDICQHLKMEPAEFYRELGLEFQANGPLACAGDDNWTARDCVALGLSIDDLLELGLQYKEQYADLMVGLTPQQAAVAEKKLQVKLEHLQQLVEAEQPQPLSPGPQGRGKAQEAPAKRTPVKYVPQIVEAEEEEQMDEEQEIQAPVARKAPLQKSIIVVEKQVPVYIEKPVVVQAAAPAPTVRIQHETPAARIQPHYVQRGAAKFNRHGALIK